VITVLFFAQLREQLNCDKTYLAIEAPVSISLLRENLVTKTPAWETFLANDKLLFSVNQVLVKAHHLVKDGDEVAFFPPVTGG
jgi:sulfur-carrier protein